MGRESPSTRKASIPSIKPGMVTHTSNPSTVEVEEGRAEVQDHVHLSSELKASLGYVRPCPKIIVTVIMIMIIILN